MVEQVEELREIILNKGYKNLDYYLNKNQDELLKILDFFIRIYEDAKIVDESFYPRKKKNNTVGKFFSISQIKKLAKEENLEVENIQNISKAIKLLGCLDLIEKIPLDNLDASSPTVKNSTKLAYSNYRKPITYYYIPEYTEEHIASVEKIAQKLKEKNITKTNCNSETIKKILGKKAVERAFVDSLPKKTVETKEPKKQEKLPKSENTGNKEEYFPLNRFEDILLTNFCNNDILNIYIFYRELPQKDENTTIAKDNITDEKNKNSREIKPDEKIEDLKKYLKTLNFKNMILRLFEFNIDAYSYSFFEEKLKKFDFDTISAEEQEKIKWLMFDLKNASGNSIISNIPMEFVGKRKLNLYFTEISPFSELQEKLPNYKFTFNASNYLTIYPTKDDTTWNHLFHQYYFEDFKGASVGKKGEFEIDHASKIEESAIDIASHSLDFANIFNTPKKELSAELLLRAIYYKIIGLWGGSEISYTPKANNKLSNLWKITHSDNVLKKERGIDDSNNLRFFHSYNTDKTIRNTYLNIYFSEPHTIPLQQKETKIIALCIIFNNKDYSKKALLQDISQYFKKDKNQGTDIIDFEALLKYIQNKKILFLPETNNLKSNAIFATRECLTEETPEIISVDSYKK